MDKKLGDAIKTFVISVLTDKNTKKDPELIEALAELVNTL